MSGTILENLSGRKLSILVTILLLSQLTCFLVGFVSPSPASTQGILSTVCLDNNPDTDNLNRWFTRQCPQKIELSEEKATVGLDARNLVFVVEMPLHDQDFSRWQQNLAGVLQIDMVYKTGYKLINPMIELTFDARLAYSDKTKNGRTPWTYYTHSMTKRFMNCVFDEKHTQFKDGYPYNCTMVPLFELGSLYHDYYLLNLRLPYNFAKNLNTNLGKIDDIFLHMIHMNGGFTKIWP